MTTIATHNGVFHADDLLAVALLLRQHPDAEVVRTRDPEVIEAADYVVDVGGKYDAATSRFDHHQRGGAGTRENGVPYSSFGLVWRHYGAEHPDVHRLVDESLAQPIDAADSGFDIYKETLDGVHPHTSSHLLASLNPGWNEENEESDFDGAFMRALRVASVILGREIARAKGLVEAEEVVRKAISDAEDPRVVVLSRFAPWQNTVVTEAPEALFVIFQAPTGDYRIQCVPDAVDSFGKRKALPEAWAGLRGDELAEATGVSDAVFCHNGRFIAGAKSLEGVTEMARQAVDG